MSKLQIAKGATNKIVHVKVPNSTATNGALLPGKAFSVFKAFYSREGEAAATVLTAEDITGTLGTYQAPTNATNFRIKEFYNGEYECHFRNELWAAGADTVNITVHENVVNGEYQPGADNIPPVPIEIELTDFDLYSAPATLQQQAAEIRKGQVLVVTTIASLASQTSFTLTDGSTDNDAYNDRIIVVIDQATSTQVAVGQVSDYVGSTKTVTLSADPAIFTMAVGDTVAISAQSPTAGGGGLTQQQVRDAMKLAATAGAPSAGSVDEHLDDILADTAANNGVLQPIADRVNNNDLDSLIGVPDTAGETLATVGYWAKIDWIQDTTKDEYTVLWIDKSTPLTSGVTLPKIQVVKRADGTDLIAETAMTAIGATGYFKHDATTGRLADGEQAIVIAKATIGGSERTWPAIIGRDA